MSTLCVDRILIYALAFKLASSVLQYTEQIGVENTEKISLDGKTYIYPHVET